MSISRSYVIMTYARCGATYLAQLLGSTGSLGRPEDWFNGKGYRDRGIDTYPLDRPGQIQTMLTAGRSANGVCGVKLSPGRLTEIAGLAWTEVLGMPRFVHLTRRDLLGRAISEVRAEQTGKWRSTSAQKAMPDYDADAIRTAIRRHVEGEAQIREYFAWNGIEPLELTYEELIADGPATVARIARFLEIEVPGEIDWTAITLAVQKDAINEEWRNRFLAKHKDLGSLPALNRGLGVLRFLKRIAA